MDTHAKNFIYLDFAAATPVDSRVIEAMRPYWGEIYSNPSGPHAGSRMAREAVEYSRSIIAEALSCHPHEIIFTSGGTESNNLSVFGSVSNYNLSNTHLITSTIEHPSVIDCFRLLESRGARVDYIGVDSDGLLKVSDLKNALNKDTKLVSIMLANNEIGTVQPVSDIKKIVRERSFDALVHTDAVQVPIFSKLNVKELDVDLLSIDSQKMYGPKSVGALYIRSGIDLTPIFYGGKQEKGLRPGTENVPGIVALGKAYEIAESERYKDVNHVTKIRDYFLKKVNTEIPKSVEIGTIKSHLPHIVNIAFPGIEAEFLVLQLDEEGVACSSRSACFGAGGEGSSVVAAINSSLANNAVRFSFGRNTTTDEIDTAINILKKKVSSII